MQKVSPKTTNTHLAFTSDKRPAHIRTRKETIEDKYLPKNHSPHQKLPKKRKLNVEKENDNRHFSPRMRTSIVSYLLYAVVDQLPRFGKKELVFFCYCLHVNLWFLFGGGFSSSWYLEWTALSYCGTPWTFH